MSFNRSCFLGTYAQLMSRLLPLLFGFLHKLTACLVVAVFSCAQDALPGLAAGSGRTRDD